MGASLRRSAWSSSAKEKTARRSLYTPDCHQSIIICVVFGKMCCPLGAVVVFTSACPIYGRFPLANRFNVDQVPLPFIVGFDTTWEESGTDRVWIRQYGNALDKRQASLQLCMAADGQSMKAAIIFRGRPDSTCDSFIALYLEYVTS